MIEQLLPAGVVAVEAFEDVPDEPVFPGEEDLVANAVEGRRREFVTARRCAREALANLAARISANDFAIERVNQRLPDGAAWVAPAEMVARSLRGFNDGTADVPRIREHMRLPAFRYSARDPYA